MTHRLKDVSKYVKFMTRRLYLWLKQLGYLNMAIGNIFQIYETFLHKNTSMY